MFFSLVLTDRRGVTRDRFISVEFEYSYFFLFFFLYETDPFNGVSFGVELKGGNKQTFKLRKKNFKLQAVTVDDSARNTRKNAAKCDNQGELQNSVTLYSSNATGALESFRALEGVLGRAPLIHRSQFNQLGIIPLFLFKKKVTSGSQLRLTAQLSLI